MIEDVVIGVGVFLILWLLAVLGRKFFPEFPHIDIWSAS